eukprot:s4770_g1.t1
MTVVASLSEPLPWGIDYLQGIPENRPAAITACALATLRLGYEVFAIRQMGVCATSKDAHLYFRFEGSSTSCDQGKGGARDNSVYRFARQGMMTQQQGLVYVLAGREGDAGFAGDQGSAWVTQLNRPNGLGVNPMTKDIYVADSGNNRIRLIFSQIGPGVHHSGYCTNGLACEVQIMGNGLLPGNKLAVIPMEQSCGQPGVMFQMGLAMNPTSEIPSPSFTQKTFNFGPPSVPRTGTYRLCFCVKDAVVFGQITPCNAAEFFIHDAGTVRIVGPDSRIDDAEVVEGMPGRPLALAIFGHELSLFDRVRLVNDSQPCGVPGAEVLAEEVQSRDILMGRRYQGNESFSLWVNVTLRASGSFRVCWCQGARIDGTRLRCERGEDFRVEAARVNIRGPIQYVGTIKTGSYEEIAVKGGQLAGFSSSDRIRLVDAATVQCGSVDAQAFSNSIENEQEDAVPSGAPQRITADSVTWTNVKVRTSQPLRVCWCGDTEACSRGEDFVIDAALIAPLLAFLALGAVRAAPLSELSADDECVEEGCALSALHLRSAKRSQDGASVDTGCHDIQPGEGGACWEAIMWGKNVGMPQHPDWYPGMTEDSPLSEWQFVAYNTTHPKCPRPCSVPPPGGCNYVPAPQLWKPAAGASLEIKVLSYNLFWWHLFKVEHGRGDSAGHLIQDTSTPPYDVMGFQECEDPVQVLGHVGLLEQYEAFQGNHAICVAYRKAAWSLLGHGEADVAQDMRTEYYGTRGTQWIRLEHKDTKRKLLFVNHHGPLSVNSGGLCGGKATAHKILQVMARFGQVGDTLVLVGDFNANAASRTLQAMWPHLHHVYNSQSFGGVDNIFANLASQDDVVSTTDLGSGGSDHHAISAVINVGSRPRETCWDEVNWAMTQGIFQHPEWYPDLHPDSSMEHFQAVVYQDNPGKCPKPCGVAVAPVSASPGPMEDGSKFSVEVLNRAQGSDGCLLEPQTEYSVQGGWYQSPVRAFDPRVCCQLCEQQGQCKAWKWTDWSAEAKDFACFLSQGAVTSKHFNDGSVSGLPKLSAVGEATRRSLPAKPPAFSLQTLQLPQFPQNGTFYDVELAGIGFDGREYIRIVDDYTRCGSRFSDESSLDVSGLLPNQASQVMNMGRGIRWRNIKFLRPAAYRVCYCYCGQGKNVGQCCQLGEDFYTDIASIFVAIPRQAGTEPVLQAPMVVPDMRPMHPPPGLWGVFPKDITRTIRIRAQTRGSPAHAGSVGPIEVKIFQVWPSMTILATFQLTDLVTGQLQGFEKPVLLDVDGNPHGIEVVSHSMDAWYPEWIEVDIEGIGSHRFQMEGWTASPADRQVRYVTQGLQPPPMLPTMLPAPNVELWESHAFVLDACGGCRPGFQCTEEEASMVERLQRESLLGLIWDEDGASDPEAARLAVYLARCRPVCGDGQAQPGEQCDDGNLRSLDGCSGRCQVESGFECANFADAPSSCWPRLCDADTGRAWNGMKAGLFPLYGEQEFAQMSSLGATCSVDTPLQFKAPKSWPRVCFLWRNAEIFPPAGLCPANKETQTLISWVFDPVDEATVDCQSFRMEYVGSNLQCNLTNTSRVWQPPATLLNTYDDCARMCENDQECMAVMFHVDDPAGGQECGQDSRLCSAHCQLVDGCDTMPMEGGVSADQYHVGRKIQKDASELPGNSICTEVDRPMPVHAYDAGGVTIVQFDSPVEPPAGVALNQAFFCSHILWETSQVAVGGVGAACRWVTSTVLHVELGPSAVVARPEGYDVMGWLKGDTAELFFDLSKLQPRGMGKDKFAHELPVPVTVTGKRVHPLAHSPVAMPEVPQIILRGPTDMGGCGDLEVIADTSTQSGGRRWKSVVWECVETRPDGSLPQESQDRLFSACTSRIQPLLNAKPWCGLGFEEQLVAQTCELRVVIPSATWCGLSSITLGVTLTRADGYAAYDTWTTRILPLTRIPAAGAVGSNEARVLWKA